MEIILKGELDLDLRRLGIQPGMTFFAQEDKVGTTGAMYFTVHEGGFSHDCVVWPENYDPFKLVNVEPLVNYTI